MFRFTIRDLLWLTVVVGLGVGWWLDRGRQRETSEFDRKTQAIQIEQLRFEIDILKGNSRGPVNVTID